MTNVAKPTLFVDIIDADGTPVLRVAGELDMATTSKLVDAGAQFLSRHHAAAVLTIDVTDLRFCDSAGLRALYQIQQNAAALDRIVVLRSPQSHVRRVIELANMIGLFTIVPFDS